MVDHFKGFIALMQNPNCKVINKLDKLKTAPGNQGLNARVLFDGLYAELNEQRKGQGEYTSDSKQVMRKHGGWH